MNNTGIYKWTSPSGKIYIGQAINLKRRYKEFTTNPYNYTYTSENSAIDRARRKYPEFSQWDYEIIATCSVEELDDLEIQYISAYSSTNSKIGYNSTKGGDGTKGCHISEDRKQQQSEIMKGKYIGEDNPMFGKNHSEETKELIRNKKLGSKQTLETIKKKSKPILQFTMEGEFVKEWIGASQVMKELGIDKASISRVCQGKKKSAGGFKWSFKEIQM